MTLPADPVPALLKPGAPEDPAWAERVRALPPADRRRALAAADSLLAAPGAPRKVALACYSALAADLDPAARPEDLERIRAALATAWCDEPGEPLYRRAIARAPDPEVVLEASVLLAQVCSQRGEMAEAARLYRTVLRRERGSTKRFVRAAISNLSRLFSSTDRDVEALLLARESARRMAAENDVWGLALSWVRVCGVMHSFGEWDRLEAALGETERIAKPLAGNARARIRISLSGYAGHLAFARGDAAAALERYDEVAALSASLDNVPYDPRFKALARADAFLALGRVEEAAQEVERGLEGRSRGDGIHWDLVARRVACAVARHESARANLLAEEILGAMTGDDGSRMGPGSRRWIALRLGRELWTAPGAQALVRRAWEEAAAAALERMLEIDHFGREWPDFAAPQREDLDALAAVGRRSVDEHRETHEAAARMLARADAEGRSLLPFFPAGGALVCVCAWCRRARTSDGLWLCVQQFMPVLPDGPIRLTHGICEECRPRLVKDLESLTPAARTA